MERRKRFCNGIVEPVANTSLPDDLPSVSDLDAIDTEGEQTLPTDAAPSEFSLDLSPPCQASTSQEAQGNSSSSHSRKELRAISLKGSKEGKRPLTSGSTLASKSPKTLGGEGIVTVVASASLLEDRPSVSDLDTIQSEGEQTLPTDAALFKFSQDLSPPCTTSTSQQGQGNSNKLRITLLSSEWRSTTGGLSTINRELAIQLAKHPSVQVSVHLPRCSEEDKRVAASHNVHLIEAQKMAGYDNPVDWLSSLPEDHAVDCVIGHGAVLGRQVQIIKLTHPYCKWIQVVHTAPEELGMYKEYEEHISRGQDKHQVEVELCKLADQVVAIGPKLAEAFSGYLRPCGKDQDVLNLTPGIFSEFTDGKQATEERKTFSVLVFGRGDNEDFQLKGYDVAAQAIAELKDMTYKLMFVGATRGDEEKVAKKLVEQGIDPSQLKVRRFNESKEKLADLFCEVDLAVMPSRTEGFGLVALEALSAGLPVLVSGNTGFAEALKKVPHGSSCVVESEDPKDWANAIRAVRHKDREMRLGEFDVVRGAYAKKYSWKEQCDKLVERMKIISSEGSKKGKRPLSPSSTPASKVPKYLGDEGRDTLVLVKLLKKEYKRRSQLRPLLWDSTIQLPIEQVYTRLKIVSRRRLVIQMEDEEEESDEEENDEKESYEGENDEVRSDEQENDEVRSDEQENDEVRSDEQENDEVESDEEENDEKESDEVNVFDIFKVPDIGEDVMTIVEGSPGIGKTTFCLKLAYDWAYGNIPSECSFPKFAFVFLLKCRDIHGDIMKAISEQLLPRDMDMEKSVEKLLHLMKNIHNQERLMLIILDGLDELPEQSRHHVDELLHRRILPFCFVLATTRQERGIEVRKSVVFDIHLEIKGYTKSDSIAYVRRHFETIGQSPKGERLIEEMQQNTFLHALRNNPLNLLLLSVVYEDYEGKLPTSRTELYQVIVQCLLRRYCAKRNLSAPEIDSTLEEMFEKEILALGELAWLCLLSDRYGFRESELDEFESRYPGLVARELGLLYKEESLKRLKPEHEYCFLHKTFQEYVAAAYIAEKLVNKQFNVFDHISFYDLVVKYQQVFILVSGMLGEKATDLFTQIGENLKEEFDCYWTENCDEEDVSFFIESFNESGHPEQMAASLCKVIPFPRVMTFEEPNEGYSTSFVGVLKACKSFSNLQTTLELYADIGWSVNPLEASDVVDYIESCPQLRIVSLALGSRPFTSSVADRLCKWLSASKSLSEFTLKFTVVTPDECDMLIQICHGLASCPTLTKVKFSLPGYTYSKGFFNALETGLTPLTSVGLELLGSMKYTAIRALQNFLSNESLKSFSLCIVGVDVQDLLVAAVSEALARQKVLKSLDLHFGGLLSSSSANFLEKGLMENSSLNYLRLCVHGELPGNWHSVVDNLRLAKNSSVVCSIYPNTWNNIADNLRDPVIVRKGLNLKQHFTFNIWGEMSCEAAEALCEALALSPIIFLTLNVRGNLTSGVANSIARCLEGNQTLSVLSINIWGELTTEGRIVLSRLSRENLSVQLNEHDVRIGPDESNNVLDINMDNPAALRAFFTKAKERRKEKVSLTINNNGYVTKEWTRCIGDALAENTLLTSLDLTVNSSPVDADFWENLGKSLLRSTSLTSLSLSFNCSNMKEGCLCNLGDSLDKMASLSSLNLDVNFYGEDKEQVVSTKVKPIKSLSTLSVGIFSDSMYLKDIEFVGGSLRESSSLEKLSLTFNVRDIAEYVFDDLADGLATTTSLNTFCLTIFSNFYFAETYSGLFAILNDGFSLNESISTLTVTLTVNESDTEELPEIFGEGLAENMSVTTLSLTINEYGEGESHIPLILDDSGVFRHLTRNTSATTFNLTLNSSREVSDDWLPGLCNAVNKNSSLTTLILKVNNHCATGESRLYDFSKLLIESRSLSLLELDVSFYGKDSGCQKVLIQ